MTHPILFFDGVCGLCNRFVDFVLRADRRRTLRFAPLQGETARQYGIPRPPDPLDWSLLYLDEHGLHDQSDATLEVLRRLGGGWRVASLLRLVPRPVRNRAYRFVARRRYRWFGRRPECRVPGPHERERFLP